MVRRTGILTLAAATAYPAFILVAKWGLSGEGVARASAAFVGILLATAVPVIALGALLLTRNDDDAVQFRRVLYLAAGVPSLFSLLYGISRRAGIDDRFFWLWIAAWVAAGIALYFAWRHSSSPRPAIANSPRAFRGLRVVHGGTALLLLVAFLILHIINHDLALWTRDLHTVVMTKLRLWYRSPLVEPVLLGLLLVMLVTGAAMVTRFSRMRMDAFRVIQTATGMAVGIFLCSHTYATLRARQDGIETDWSFAAGTTSLLDGTAGLGARLIPHYFFGVFFLIVHVGCGLRIVLLKHGLPEIAASRVMYVISIAGLLASALSLSALLGAHVGE